jgi:transposase
MSKPRRKYTREFKLAAVKLITEQGRSVAEAARSLGVSEKQFRHRKAVLQQQGQQQAFPGSGHLPPADAELRRLKEENQRLRAERDLLKKPTPANLTGVARR